MGGNNKYQSTIGQNHSRRLGGIITAGACVPIILQSRLQKVKALVGLQGASFEGCNIGSSTGDLVAPLVKVFKGYIEVNKLS